MELNDSSTNDIDTLKKQIGGEYKTFIKTNSKDYLEKLKSELMKGFKTYFDDLNTRVTQELQAQETQQKSIHDKIESKEKKSQDMHNLVSRRKDVDLHERIFKNELTLKRKCFLALAQRVMFKKENRKKEALVNKIMLENKTRKVFKALKNETLFAKTLDYEDKIKLQTQNELNKMADTYQKQKEEMWNLINKAQEKLKHENRKKVQVKLMLDQMVLRGISALNMQAMALSQNSLKDVVKCDYNKDIDKKYSQMLFPATKTTFKTKYTK
jgi:hypothetical protein